MMRRCVICKMYYMWNYWLYNTHFFPYHNCCGGHYFQNRTNLTESESMSTSGIYHWRCHLHHPALLHWHSILHGHRFLPVHLLDQVLLHQPCLVSSPLHYPLQASSSPSTSHSISSAMPSTSPSASPSVVPKEVPALAPSLSSVWPILGLHSYQSMT